VQQVAGKQRFFTRPAGGGGENGELLLATSVVCGRVAKSRADNRALAGRVGGEMAVAFSTLDPLNNRLGCRAPSTRGDDRA
jgi:hypothetical protein